MPQLDFNLFFSDFFWLIINLIFFYIFFLIYILPTLLKSLILRKFLINYYLLKIKKLQLKIKNLNFFINLKFKILLKTIFNV